MTVFKSIFFMIFYKFNNFIYRQLNRINYISIKLIIKIFLDNIEFSNVFIKQNSYRYIYILQFSK